MLISKTPLRISFVGGGTDLASYYRNKPGNVISTAINKYIYVIIKKRIDNLIVLHYTKNEIVTSIDEIQHEIIKECMRLVGLECGIEIITLSDITTQGSGLGSSSVLTVGLLNAMFCYKGIVKSNKELAELACKVEIDILKKPIGKQDQFIAVYGGIHKFIFNPDDSVSVIKININEELKNRMKKNIFIFNTNITRKADKILNEQNASAEKNEKSLDYIANLVNRFENCILEDDIDSIGIILNDNWLLKKNLANGITNTQIDQMVSNALNGGSTGCKIAGAGGGGYLICYVPLQKHLNFLESMKIYKLVEFDFEQHGSKIVFNSM